MAASENATVSYLALLQLEDMRCEDCHGIGFECECPSTMLCATHGEQPVTSSFSGRGYCTTLYVDTLACGCQVATGDELEA